jgi:hypothetical protein
MRKIVAAIAALLAFAPGAEARAHHAHYRRRKINHPR